MKHVMRYADYLIRAIEVVCFALMAFMTLATFGQAINRFVFHGSFFWAEESAIMSMIYIAFLGAALAIRRNAHTRIDFLILLLPAKVKRYVDALDNVICATFLAFLGRSALPIIIATGTQKTVGMGVPRSLYYYAILISCILMVFYLILLAVCKIVDYDPDKEARP